jgi:GTPase SAR1 family protein
MAKAQIAKRQDASLPNLNMLVIGASGSGKSSFLRQEIDFKQPRIIAWDPDEDFTLPRVRDMATFKKMCMRYGFGPIRVALTVNPTEESFEEFAGLVYAICHAKAPMTILADEIADVTRIGKASPNWGQLCRKVRKYGGRLVACTQRPQEADKTIFNQAKIKWCGALSSQAAYKFMAGEMDVPLIEFKALDNIEQVQVQYWSRDGTRQAAKHTMTFKKERKKTAVRKVKAKA